MNTTPQERLALGALGLLLAAGGVARAVRGGPAQVEWSGSDPPGAVAALRAAVDDSTRRQEARDRPLGAGERLDANTASQDELTRLPGVGPALAARIVEHRERRRLRTLADLDSVPGVGPALLRKVAPHLTLAAGRASPARSRAPAAPPRGAPAVVDLNRATVADLEALPGVGPAIASRIIDWRERRGAFRTVDDLQQVPGIGPATLARIRGAVRVSP